MKKNKSLEGTSIVCSYGKYIFTSKQKEINICNILNFIVYN